MTWKPPVSFRSRDFHELGVPIRANARSVVRPVAPDLPKGSRCTIQLAGIADMEDPTTGRQCRTCLNTNEATVGATRPICSFKRTGLVIYWSCLRHVPKGTHF